MLTKRKLQWRFWRHYLPYLQSKNKTYITFTKHQGMFTNSVTTYTGPNVGANIGNSGNNTIEYHIMLNHFGIRYVKNASSSIIFNSLLTLSICVCGVNSYLLLKILLNVREFLGIFYSNLIDFLFLSSYTDRQDSNITKRQVITAKKILCVKPLSMPYLNKRNSIKFKKKHYQ